MIYFIIQARSGSSRMPQKILLPFYKGESILDLLINKLKQIKGTKVLIATSDNPNCSPIEEIAKKHNVYCFRGSENDVLQRFIEAAEHYQANRIIRICSDNPFLDVESIKLLIEEVNKSEGYLDYASFNVNGTPSIKTHFGFWTEYVTLEALKRVYSFTDEQLYHEHVTNYIYLNPEKFIIKWINVPKIIESHPDIRLTIDTLEDFENAREIYSNLCQEYQYPTIDQIISYLDCHKNYYIAMKNQIEKNSK